MINVTVDRSILVIVDAVSVGTTTTPIRLISRNNGLVTNNDQEGRVVGIVSALDLSANGRGSGAAGNSVDINIDTLLFLPSQPVLESGAALVVRSGNHKHLHWCSVKILVVIVCTTNGSFVEQLLIDNVEIRAVGLHEHVLGGTCIGTVEEDFHFDVVEHTNDVVDGVVAHGLDGHLAELHTTHGTHHVDRGHRRAAETAGRLVGGLIHDERHFLWVLVLTQ